MDYTPKVLFKESPKSLLSQQPRQLSGNNDSSPTRRNNNVARPTPFPIESLAAKLLPPYITPSSTQLKHEAYAQELKDSANDGMDWEPSTHSIQLSTPTPYAPPPNPFKPSPPPSVPRAGFKGRLPPNIHSPAARLRNPLKPEFRAATPATKTNFFASGKRDKDHFGDDGLDELPPSPANSIFSNLSPTKIAEPRFFAKGHGGDETGLETMFERAFTVGEVPAEVREMHARQARPQKEQRPHPAYTSVVLAGTVAVAGVMFWWVEGMKAGR